MMTDSIPEQGQLVRRRGRHSLVQDVFPYQANRLPTPAGWEPTPRFQAFLHAVEWSTSSVEGAGEQGETRKRGVERAAVGGRQASLPGLEDPSPWQLGVFEEEGE